MAKVTNKELSEELSYIRGKLEAEERFAKEHRAWEVIELQKIDKKLDDQNGRVRKNSEKLHWISALGLALSTGVGWLFRKIYW